MLVKNLTKLFLVLALAMPLLASACAPVMHDGEVEQIFVGTVLRGFDNAINDRTGTYRYIKESYTTLIFPVANNFGMVLIDNVKLAAVAPNDAIKLLGGQCMNCLTTRDFVNWLESNGWTATTGASVDPRVRSAIIGATAWYATIARGWCTLAFGVTFTENGRIQFGPMMPVTEDL